MFVHRFSFLPLRFVFTISHSRLRVIENIGLTRSSPSRSPESYIILQYADWRRSSGIASEFVHLNHCCFEVMMTWQLGNLVKYYISTLLLVSVISMRVFPDFNFLFDFNRILMMDFIPIKDFSTLQQREEISRFFPKIQTFCSKELE